MKHILVGEWVIIGSGNGLSPDGLQAITWTNGAFLSIGFLGTNLSEIWIGTLPFSFKKIHVKMSSAKMVTILSRGRWVNSYTHSAAYMRQWTATFRFMLHEPQQCLTLWSSGENG